MNLLSGLLICAGVALFVAGTVGLWRFPDTLSRLHALSKADGLGLGFITLGLLPMAGGVLPAIKLVLVWLLLLFSGAVAAQLIAEHQRRVGPPE